jgi:dTDP-4-amino-4,6-dideoxygalactose transaminase
LALPQPLPLQPFSKETAPIAVARPLLPPADAILPYLRRIDEARWYSNFGPLLEEFEQRLETRFRPGTKVVTLANATQALTLALKAMELPAGGLVVLPSWTFVATAHAVMAAGLKPRFVDVDPQTWMLAPDAVMQLLPSLEAAAVIPVCAFGAMPDLAAWRAFRDETGVPVLIDAAAAFDTLADARLPAVVSLHATKVLGIGEGGFLATEDEALARKVRLQSVYGFQGNRDSRVPATNSKLSEYAAAVGMAAMDAWPSTRLRFLRAAQHLRIALTGQPHVTFQDGWGAGWVTSVCTVALPHGSADTVAQRLNEAGVQTRAWWGKGCHTSPAFADCSRGPLPVTEALAESTLGLPFSIDLDVDDMAYLAAALGDILAGL